MSHFVRLIVCALVAVGTVGLPELARASKLELREPSLSDPRAAPPVLLLPRPQLLDLSKLAETFLPPGGSATPLDDGGGDGAPVAGLPPALALLLGVIVGFGVGHIVEGNVPGFVLWLVVDVLVVSAAILVSEALGGVFTLVAWIVFGAERIGQGIDAYRSAAATYADAESVDHAIFGQEAAVEETPFAPALRIFSWPLPQ